MSPAVKDRYNTANAVKDIPWYVSRISGLFVNITCYNIPMYPIG